MGIYSLSIQICNMSVREYSLYNPAPWISGGVVLSPLRVLLAQLKTQASFLGVSARIWSRFSLGLRGHRFRGVLTLLGLLT